MISFNVAVMEVGFISLPNFVIVVMLELQQFAACMFTHETFTWSRLQVVAPY